MIAALIPVKDESAIKAFVIAVGAWVDRVVVVDDSTETIYGTDAMSFIGRGSLGGSLQDGLVHLGRALRVVTIDAGWAHDPRDIPRLLKKNADVVIGSRFCPKGRHEGPWWRSAASRSYAWACSWVTGYRVKDWTSGFRAYSPAAVRVISRHKLVSKRHACQAEFLKVCLDAGLTVAEVPISYRVMPGSTMNQAAAVEACKLWWSFT